jgi:hypothetical protein
MNPVKRRIRELARFDLGRHKKFIRKVRRKVISPNRRYAWQLYCHDNDAEPVDTIVLDVNHAEATLIDQNQDVQIQHFPESPAPSRKPAALALGYS